MSYVFQSRLSVHFIEYIEERDRLGYVSAPVYKALRCFDKYIVKEGFDDGTLSEECCLSFLGYLRARNLGASYFNNFVSTLRNLSLFLMTKGEKAYFVYSNNFRPYEEPNVYIPSQKELETFIHFIDKIKSKTQAPKIILNQLSRKMILRLLYLCGLRIGEAINLKRSDFDFKENTMYIRHSKGDNDRIVGFDPVVLTPILMKFDLKAEKISPNREFFFISTKGTKIDRGYFETWFKEKWKACFPYCTKNNLPTPHSLRHSFIIHRIDKWSEEGKDLKKLLPYLSKYLGHKSIEGTWYYYQSHLNHTQASYQAICENTALSEEIINELL